VCEAARVHNHSSATQPGLTLTGDPMEPGTAHENYWFRRREVAYRAVLPYCRHADILDVDSGAGYGDELLRTEAGARVVTLDREPRTVGRIPAARPAAEEAGQPPPQPTAQPARLSVRASLTALPFNDGTFDAVIGMHVVENVWDQRAFVRESVRMLRPLGTLLLSTVNRLTAPAGGAAPATSTTSKTSRNLAPDELVDLLDSWFLVTRVLGVSHGPRVTAWEAEHEPVVHAQQGPAEHWPRHLRELVGSLTTDDFVVSPSEVDGALDILVVAARR
jgi:2-polyprenyl-3-methyl-5-hydroxy-6-metoxy-1,4-benzoquinol methylase